jgi:hypothetical protein
MNRLFRRAGLMVLSTLMLQTSCQEFDEPLYKDNSELSPILREIKDIPAITDGSLSLPDVGKSFGTDDNSQELTLSNGTFGIDWNSAALRRQRNIKLY